MKALSLHQPWAQLCVTLQPCDLCAWGEQHTAEQHHMVKRFETRSWPCPPNLIGSRIALHATKKPGGVLADPMVNGLHFGEGSRYYNRRDFPLGAVVGSAVIEACYPIVNGREWVDMFADRIEILGDTLWLRLGGSKAVDISDQLPYGDFTPGGYAWLLGDAAPCTERCPWCWGTAKRQGSCDHCENTRIDPDNFRDAVLSCPVCSTAEGKAKPCPVCDGAGRCEPIPARGRQRLWNWQPL